MLQITRSKEGFTVVETISLFEYVQEKYGNCQMRGIRTFVRNYRTANDASYIAARIAYEIRVGAKATLDAFHKSPEYSIHNEKMKGRFHISGWQIIEESPDISVSEFLENYDDDPADIAFVLVLMGKSDPILRALYPKTAASL